MKISKSRRTILLNGIDRVIGLSRLFTTALLVGNLTGHLKAQTGCDTPVEADFNPVTLVSGLDEPMEAEFITEGRILIIEKVTGKVLLLKRDATAPTIAMRLAVSMAGNRADGLLGLEPDPAFAINGWIYLYYSPKGTEAVNIVSRFTMIGDVIDPASEKRVLKVTTHRNACCHLLRPPPNRTLSSVKI